jgi:hypothetical protein
MATDSPASGRRGTAWRGWAVFAVVLLLSLVPEFFIHHHATFGPEGHFGFYAGYSLLACLAWVAVARLLGGLLRRRETYYDPD